jgi:hypothetical protein
VFGSVADQPPSFTFKIVPMSQPTAPFDGGPTIHPTIVPVPTRADGELFLRKHAAAGLSARLPTQAAKTTLSRRTSVSGRTTRIRFSVRTAAKIWLIVRSGHPPLQQRILRIRFQMVLEHAFNIGADRDRLHGIAQKVAHHTNAAGVRQLDEDGEVRPALL